MSNKKDASKTKLFTASNIKCYCCGKMVPDEGFPVEIEGKKQLFCTKGCYNFSIEYKKFREGGKI